MQSIRNLRPYQVKTVDKLNAAISDGEKHILLVLPTGGGKTDVACSFIKQAKKDKKTTLFVVHTKELVDNASDRLDKYYDINGTFIKAGYPFDADNLVKICSIQTLSNMKDMPHADYIFWDEAHRCEAKSYQKIFEHYKDAIHIGLTATWFRGDGSGLGDTFDFIIHLAKYGDLLKKGWLSPTRIYVPDTVDMSGVEIIGGEYNSKQMAVRFSKKEILASNVRNYLKYAKGRKAIAYNCNVSHSKTTCAYFNRHGIPSAHIDGNMKKGERERILADFEAGKYLVLHNVSIFTEGFDSPNVSCIILNRATKSKTLYIQMTGRGVRVIDGYSDCVVLDFGDNARKFGKIEDYDIDGATLFVEKPQEKTVGAPLKCCPECELMNLISAIECIECGYSFKEADEAEKVRVEMELVEFERARLKAIEAKRLRKFISKANKVHGVGRYDYTSVKYTGSNRKVEIKCNKCGSVFWQIAAAHASGRGCNSVKCSRAAFTVLGNEKFFELIKRAGIVGFKYPELNYIGSKSKIRVCCPVGHEYFQRAVKHIESKKCPVCTHKWGKIESPYLQKYKNEWWLSKVKKMGITGFVYPRLIYVNNTTNIVIKKEECGHEYEQMPNNHLKSRACPVCNKDFGINRISAYKIKDGWNDGAVEQIKDTNDYTTLSTGLFAQI